MFWMLISDLKARSETDDVRRRKLNTTEVGKVDGGIDDGRGVEFVDGNLTTSQTGNVIVIERQRRCGRGDHLMSVTDPFILL